MLTSAVLMTAGTFVNADLCNRSEERQIVDSILATNYQRANALIDRLDVNAAVIPSKEFYSALSQWYYGYQFEDKKRKKSGATAMMAAINNLDAKLQAIHSSHTDDAAVTRSHLAAGLSKGHGARILMEGGAIYSGYKLATAALAHLDQFLAAASPETQGYHDAKFLRGLYEIYTHDLKTRSNWLAGLISYRGNRHLGIALIEKMINEPAIFAIEGMKSLLAEVSWQTPDICQYRDGIDLIGDRFAFNRDFITLRQGLLLKCGFFERALLVNQEYRGRVIQSKLAQEILNKSELRIRAGLGMAEEIDQVKISEKLRADQLMAKANALDVRGQRDAALSLYLKIKRNQGISKVYRTVATSRIKYPFHRSIKRNVPQFIVSPCTYLPLTDQH